MTKDKVIESLILYFMQHESCQCIQTFDDKAACQKCNAIREIREHFPIHFELACDVKRRRKQEQSYGVQS